MSWTVTIAETVKGTGFLIVRVSLTNGVITIRPDEYRVTTETELKQKINADIARLESVDALPSIAVGLYDPTPKPATQDVLDAQAFAEKLRILRQLKDYATLGVLDPADPSIAQAITDAQTTLQTATASSGKVTPLIP